MDHEISVPGPNPMSAVATTYFRLRLYKRGDRVLNPFARVSGHTHDGGQIPTQPVASRMEVEGLKPYVTESVCQIRISGRWRDLWSARAPEI